MKTKLTMLVAFMLVSATAIFAQGFQRQTVPERVKATMDKLSSLQLNQSQSDKASAIFTDYYTSMSKMREEARSSGNRPDRSVYEKMTSDRDEKLKAVLTADQFTKYTNEVEATLRPQRNGGNN